MGIEIVLCIMTICVFMVCMGKYWEMDRRVSWIEDMMMTHTEDEEDEDDGEEDGEV